MSDKQGWIKLYRKIQDNPLWAEKRKFSRAEAWIDILMEVQHSKEPSRVLLGSVILMCNRGESLKSLDTWALRWGWTKSTVRRYLSLLQNMKQIRFENATKTTRITVCNYDAYNEERNCNGTGTERKQNTNRTHMEPDKNEDNENNEKNEDSSFAISGENDFKKQQIPRDVLLDYLASIDGDVAQLTKSAIGRAAKALSQIKDVCPNLTPEEIQRRSNNYKTHFDGCALTTTALAKHWAKCDKARPQSTNGNPSSSLYREADRVMPF